MPPLMGCGASGNVSGVKFESHSAFYDLWDEPSVSPRRHRGGWSPAPCMDSTGRPRSIKIQLPPLTWQALTFCRGSHWAAGNRLESEWCFSAEDEASPATVPLRCHSPALPPRPRPSPHPICILVLLFSFLASCYNACVIKLIKDQRRNKPELPENTAEPMHWLPMVLLKCCIIYVVFYSWYFRWCIVRIK